MKKILLGFCVAVVLGLSSLPSYVHSETLSSGGPCPNVGQNVGGLCYRTDTAQLFLYTASQVWTQVLLLPNNGVLTLSTPTITGGTIGLASSTFAALGTPVNGSLLYCSDCTITALCAGAGTGALAKRVNTTWICN